MILTSLRAPSPSRATCSARLASTCANAARNAFSRGSLARAIFGAPRAAPVAKTSNVSEVEVSPSTVTALKRVDDGLGQDRLQAGAAIGASVNTKDSIVAMSGAIMPAPLAMPLIVTVAPPIFACAVATFGNVSVVMIALAASSKRAGRGRSRPAPASRRRIAAPAAARRSRRSRRGTPPPACSRTAFAASSR